MKRAVFFLPLLGLLSAATAATSASAASLAIGSGSGPAGGTAAVPLTFASGGASVASFQVDLLFASPLSFSGIAMSAAATAAGKQAGSTPISGGVRLIVFGLNQTPMPEGAVATVTLGIASGAGSGSYPVTGANSLAADPGGNTVALSVTSGSVAVGSAPPAVASWILPSSAHSSGANGAFYTTDLAVSNTGPADGQVTVKFLGHDGDGRGGAEATLSVGAGKMTVVPDVLGSLFGVSSGYGAIRVSSSVATLAVAGQTATPAPDCVGGTFGQSVPAVGAAQLVASGTPRTIMGVREDALFRTNLILANAGSTDCSVDVSLLLGDGTSGGTKSYSLAPLGMTQASRVVRDLGYPANVSSARLVVSTSSCAPGAALYASVIDNRTNDPRTLLPQ